MKDVRMVYTVEQETVRWEQESKESREGTKGTLGIKVKTRVQSWELKREGGGTGYESPVGPDLTRSLRQTSQHHPSQHPCLCLYIEQGWAGGLRGRKLDKVWVKTK